MGPAFSMGRSVFERSQLLDHHLQFDLALFLGLNAPLHQSCEFCAGEPAVWIKQYFHYVGDLPLSAHQDPSPIDRIVSKAVVFKIIGHAAIGRSLGGVV